MRKVSLWGYTIFENGKIVGLQGKEIKQGKQIKVKWGNAGKPKMVSYARFVYYAFNYKNFNFNDKTIVIKHKNGDEKDCGINNLITINRKYINNPSIIKSYILNLSNNIILDNIDTIIIPILIILENIPFSFVIHVKYANIGEQNANKVHPIIIILL